MVQRHKNFMAVSKGCMQVVSAPSLHCIWVVLSSVAHMGMDIVMQLDDAITEFTNMGFGSWYAAFEVFDSNSLH
jgi:hypothetical protein